MSQPSASRYYSAIRNSLFSKLFLCCLVTLAAMYAHRFFPEKTLTLVPAGDTVAYIYMDGSPDGRSRVEWINQEALQWRCTVEADGVNYTCGFHVTIAGGQGSMGMDLSSFDAVRVDMAYKGSDRRLRFYMRNYEPNFSNIDRIETAKFNYLSIPVQYIGENLVLHMKEFSVADWWIHAFQVPREVAQPNFTNVVAFGVDLYYPASPGQHDLKLNKIEFVGLWISAESWYYSILIFWIIVIVGAGTVNLLKLRRSIHLERVRLGKLTMQNTLLEAQSNKYKELSLRDHLTKMLNRQGLSELIEEHYAAGSDQQVALLIIDLDHFKLINDNLGHDGGDIVLRKVAEIINMNIRQSDYAARWGGEEFVVISPGTEIKDGLHLAEKLRNLIATHKFEKYPYLQVTASIGIGGHRCEDSFHVLFRRVDIALYQAKAQGRNRTVVAQDE